MRLGHDLDRLLIVVTQVLDSTVHEALVVYLIGVKRSLEATPEKYSNKSYFIIVPPGIVHMLAVLQKTTYVLMYSIHILGLRDLNRGAIVGNEMTA
jgi:hypothetical protein